MKHPFLFYSAHDVDKYREKLKKDPQAKARYDSIVASADKCLKEPIVSWKELNGGISQHANFGMMSGQARKWLNTLGLKYLVERDEKCAEKLKGLLLKYISFERWFGIAYTKRTPVPWHSDLSSTATTLACGMIYDAIHDYLTEEERKQISEGLFEKGILSALGDWALPETRIHAIDSMGHNWWAVCIAESATALLALQDQLPQARVKEVFGYVNEALATYLSYKGNVLFNKFGNFDDQGMFYESVGYNNYGTGTLLRYLWCYERYFGRNDVIRKEIPPRLCDGVMGFSYPVSREDGKVDYLFLNYGDSSLHTQIGLLGTYAYRNGLDTSALRACIKNYGVDIWEEIGGLDLSHLEGSAESLEKTMIYSSGYAVTRDSWKPDATLLSVKSGFCWNHSHNDSGSFVIFHKGKEFFNDDGSCSYYGNVKDLYHNYYCQDHAHSVLKVGGKGRRDEELYRGTKFIGRIIDHYQNKDLLFLQTDCTGPMAHLVSRMYRNFVWIDSRILVIVDNVFAHAEDTVQFTLHYNGTYENKDDGVYFTYEDCRARFKTIEPAGMIQAERVGHPCDKQEEDKIYLEFSTPEKNRTQTLISVLELEPQEHKVKYKKLTGKNASGVLVCDGRKEYEIWYNHMADGHIMHDNSNAVIAGFETDGYMLIITRDKDEGSEKVLMVCGSYLRRGGKVLAASFSKQTKETVAD